MKGFVFLFSFSFLFAMPQWFYHIKSDRSNYYIGYGMGDTLTEAKTNALNDISSQISVKINSKFERNVNNYKKNITQKLSTVTNSTLNDYEVLKSVKEDKYYIAIGYENIPNIDKFISKLPENIKISNNKFLNSTLLAKYIKQKTGKFIAFDVYFKDGNWYISYGNTGKILDYTWFKKLFITYGNRLKTNHKYNVFHSGDNIKVYFNAKHAGYVTLFDVDSKGAVYILINNQKVKKGWNELRSKDFNFQAYTDKKEDFEMYVAVFDKIPLKFSEFSLALEPNDNHDYGILLNVLNKYNFNTLKIITKGN